MEYWHIVEDKDGKIKEQIKSKFNKSKLSLECLATVLNGKYKIIQQPCVK